MAALLAARRTFALLATTALAVATTQPFAAATEPSVRSAPARPDAVVVAVEEEPVHGAVPVATTGADLSLLLRDLPGAGAARQRVGATDSGSIVLDGRPVPVGPGGEVDWTDAAGRGRSFQRQLHGLLIVADLAVLAAEGDTAARRLAMGIVDHWVADNPRSAPAHPMAWHDETTAMRTMQLLTLRSVLSGAERDRVDALLRTHVQLLLTDAFHSTGTNHGMFQDRAILAWANSPAASGSLVATASTTATRRLLAYFTAIISSDGVHLEHSPAYHQVIFNNLNRHLDFFAAVGDRSTASTLSGLRSAMVRYATHVLQPDGSFPAVGDTMDNNRPSSRLTDDPGYRFASTAGRQGAAPTETDAFFPAAGYAIMRDAWRPGPAGTYLHFTAAYHNHYHKHADDLSLWIYHDGELLTEAGAHGYEWSDPLTGYGQGASAHNTVLVDGAGVPRHDGRYEAVRLTSASRSGQISTVTATTRRIPNADWRRQVRYDRGAGGITVTDDLTLDRSRRVSLLWHTAPGVRATLARDGSVLLTRHGVIAARLQVTTGSGATLTPTVKRGARSPIAGWRLGGGEPTAVDTLTFDHTTGAPRLVTRIALAAAPPPTVSTATRCGSEVSHPFTDVSGAHAAAIACAVREGITAGTTADTYTPDAPVTRAQLTSMLARTLAAVGAELPAPTTLAVFADVTDGPHRANIAAMHAAGLVHGSSPGRFDPGAPITRAQTATLLVRTLEHLSGTQLPEGADHFPDVAGVHAPAIRKATTAGLVAGDGRTGFAPRSDLTRAQTATLLTRLLAAADA